MEQLGGSVIADVKQHPQNLVIRWVTLSSRPPLYLQSLAPNLHWARVEANGTFSLCIAIHN
jgi:hypothetical protein